MQTSIAAVKFLFAEMKCIVLSLSDTTVTPASCYVV